MLTAACGSSVSLGGLRLGTVSDCNAPLWYVSVFPSGRFCAWETIMTTLTS